MKLVWPKTEIAIACGWLVAGALLVGCGDPAPPPDARQTAGNRQSPRPVPPRPSARTPEATTDDNSDPGDDASDTNAPDIVSDNTPDNVPNEETNRHDEEEAQPDEAESEESVGENQDDHIDESADDASGDGEEAFDRPPPQTAEEAVAALKEIGGRVTVQDGAPLQVFLNRTQATDWHMQAVAQLSDVTMLNISHTQVTDAGLEHLRGLTKLERLYPHGSRVTDAGLDTLGKDLPQLHVVQ